MSDKKLVDELASALEGVLQEPETAFLRCQKCGKTELLREAIRKVGEAPAPFDPRKAGVGVIGPVTGYWFCSQECCDYVERCSHCGAPLVKGKARYSRKIDDWFCSDACRKPNVHFAYTYEWPIETRKDHVYPDRMVGGRYISPYWPFAVFRKLRVVRHRDSRTTIYACRVEDAHPDTCGRTWTVEKGSIIHRFAGSRWKELGFYIYD